MASLLNERLCKELEPVNDSAVRPDPERIKALALEKVRVDSSRKGKFSMRKGRILLIAAVLAVILGVTVVAVGGMEYFRSIFGDSVENAGEGLTMPGIEVHGEDGYSMRAEAVLTDGYQTNVVFSTYYGEKVENLDDDLIAMDDETENQEGFNAYLKGPQWSSSINAMPEFGSRWRRYYHLQMTTMENCKGDTVSIRKGQEGPVLEIPLNGAESVYTVELGLDAGGGRVIESLQLSPMGILLISNEKEAKGSLPTVAVEVVMTDGKREDATVEFDYADDGVTISGGGGAVILDEGQTAPLVVMTSGRRNPDGKLVAMGTFSRLLDLGKVQSVVVEATEYPFSAKN